MGRYAMSGKKPTLGEVLLSICIVSILVVLACYVFAKQQELFMNAEQAVLDAGRAVSAERLSGEA